MCRFPLSAFEQRRPSDKNLPRAGVPAPALSGKSSKESPGKRGNVFFSLRALREVTQRVNRKGSSNTWPGIRGDGHATAVVTPLHFFYSTLALKPETRSPSAHPCRERNCQKRDLSSLVQVHQRPIGTDRVRPVRLKVV